ncbi:hypothetical protein C8R45DRAFT_832163, partial [Mycena sanguinolenta]
PTLNWGLLLGCNLVRFKSEKGTIVPAKGRLCAILVSIAWNQIWSLRTNRVIKFPDRTASEKEIHNHWLAAINRALQRDRLLTNKVKLGPLALNKQLVLNTWSGLLMDEASLPDDWTNEGVLVGMRPITDRHGIG